MNVQDLHDLAHSACLEQPKNDEETLYQLILYGISRGIKHEGLEAIHNILFKDLRHHYILNPPSRYIKEGNFTYTVDQESWEKVVTADNRTKMLDFYSSLMLSNGLEALEHVTKLTHEEIESDKFRLQAFEAINKFRGNIRKLVLCSGGIRPLIKHTEQGEGLLTDVSVTPTS